MRPATLLLALVIVLGLPPGRSPGGLPDFQKAKADVAADLDGTWQVTSMDSLFRRFDTRKPTWTFAFRGGRFEERCLTFVTTGALRLNRFQNPPWITINQDWAGIFSLQRDTLILCVAPAWAERPKSFTPEGRAAIWTLKRVR